MLKIGLAVVAAFAAGFFFLHRADSSSAARVRSCLQKTGASVQQSAFLEQSAAEAAAEQGQTLPDVMRKALRAAERNLYDVNFADSSALLIFTKGGRQADALELQLAQLSEVAGMGGSGRYGKVLVLWPQPPTDSAAAALDGCLK